jgi:hypothetical protein
MIADQWVLTVFTWVPIDVHFVRDQVYNKELVIKFISSKDQLADALTKPLPPVKFS